MVARWSVLRAVVAWVAVGLSAVALPCFAAVDAYEVLLAVPAGQKVAPGATAEYEATIENRGSAQESLLLRATSSTGLSACLSRTRIDLAPQERAQILVSLPVPLGEPPGQDVLTITATSTLHDGIGGQGLIYTTILPPTPDLVGRRLMETLSSRLCFSIDRDELSDDFDSRMTFSASGSVLDGHFSALLDVDDPLGPDPVDVSSYLLLYRRGPTTAAIGSISRSLTDLVTVTCEGGSFDLDDEFCDAGLIVGISDDEARFGGRLALGPDVANAGVTYFETRSPTGRDLIAGATAEAMPLEDWELRLEGAYGELDGLPSLAVLFTTQVDTEGYFLDGEVFSIGTHFPGWVQDVAGIRLSQRLRLTGVSIGLSFSHERDNVDRNPLLATQIEDLADVNVSGTPIGDGPLLSSTAEFGWSRDEDPTVRSEMDLSLSMGVREADGFFPYAFSGEIESELDLVHNTHVRTLTFSEGAGISVDSFYLFLELAHEKRVDVPTDTVLSGATEVSILFRPEGTLHEASVSVREEEDAIELGTSLFVRLLDSVEIVFDGSIGWDRADATPVSFGWGVTFNVDFAVPLPFLVTKGSIEGRVFVDADGDETFGAADRAVAGGTVAAHGTAVSTDDAGFFRFPPLPPGAYALGVGELPPGVAAPEPIQVLVAAGKTTIVEIPLGLTGTVPGDEHEGVAFPEESDAAGRPTADFTVSPASPSVGEAVSFDASPSRDDGEIASYAWDFDGDDVVDATTALASWAFTTPGDVPVRLTVTDDEENEGSVTRTVFVRAATPDGEETTPPAPSVRPPVADFSISPSVGIVNLPIAFDGGSSFDFDGEIVSYGWDFDGDAEDDAVGSAALRVYRAPGTYSVTLRVTDDGGNVDLLTRTVEVVEPVEEPAEVEPASDSPTASFSYVPGAPTSGEAVAFDGTTSTDPGGIIASYEWDFDGDRLVDATGPLVEHAFAVAGTYLVTLTVTSEGGMSDAVSHAVDVAGLPAPPTTSGGETVLPPIADFTYAPEAPLVGEPVQFNGMESFDFDGGIIGYAWDFQSDGVIDATSPIVLHVFPTAGSYRVRLTVTDTGGATDTAERTIVVE
jgi:PKD repeat protein